MSRSKSHKKYKIRSNRKTIIAIGLSVAISIIVIVAMLVPVYNMKKDTERDYSQAIALIEAGNYTEAYQKLEEIVGQNYLDSIHLLYYCSSRILYDEGKVVEAYKELEKVKFYNETDEQHAEIEEFREKLTKEYEAQEGKDKDSEENVTTSDAKKATTSDAKKDDTKKGKNDIKGAEEEFAYEETESFENEDENKNENKNENN